MAAYKQQKPANRQPADKLKEITDQLATIGDTDFLNIPDPVFEEAGA